MSYEVVTKELGRGTPPELLCATCPWDRLCITPPTMTRDEVERQIKAAAEPKPGAGPDDRGFAGALITTMLIAGKDTSAQVCPVFAMRLSSTDGRGIADGVRSQMRDWVPGRDNPETSTTP